LIVQISIIVLLVQKVEIISSTFKRTKISLVEIQL